MPLLSIIIFLPFFASIAVLFIPRQSISLIRTTAIFISFLIFTLSSILLFTYKTGVQGFSFLESVNWITLDLGNLGRLSIDYIVGIDGISLPLLWMSSLIFFIALISSSSIKEKQKGYYSLMLLLLAAVNGCFAALDFFLFFLFFEFMLLPMYFLIGIWGGPRREYAAIKFFLYTLLGSVFILLVMIALYISVKDPLQSKDGFIVHTFRFDYLADLNNLIPGSLLSPGNTSTFLGISFRGWAFLLLLIGFLIKLPSFPFHTWLPDAHVEAPTPVSVILAAVLLKIGGYGLIRIAIPFFPLEAIQYAPYIAFIGMFSILWAAYNALAMTDLKKMIAYSSVSHMGFVTLGLASFTAEGVSGALYQMVSHGFISASLFLIAGVVYEQTHDRTIHHYKGLANQMPVYTFVVVISFFASLGLPGLSGFLGEILVFLGAFNSSSIPKWITLLSTIGLVLGASYYLWTLQRMFFGKFWVNEKLNVGDLKDLNWEQKFCFLPLLVLIVLLGIFPDLLTQFFSSDIKALLSSVLGR